MKNMNVYIKKTLIDDKTIDELDFEMHTDFDFNYDVHEDFIEIQDGQGDADGFPINIDLLITSLQELKEKGATHIEMDYHIDHIGYGISGYEIRKATKDEIDAHLGKKTAATKAATEAEINRLKKKLEELESSDE